MAENGFVLNAVFIDQVPDLDPNANRDARTFRRQRLVAQLMLRKMEWALIGYFSSAKSAQTAAVAIKRELMNMGYPHLILETKVRCLEGVNHLFARCIQIGKAK